MSTQEYLSVLVSIIIGLGISHLLAGVGRMVVARRLVRVWWGSLAVAAFIFLTQVQWWWSTIHSGEHLATNFFGFVFFLLVPIALYLLAVLNAADVCVDPDEWNTMNDKSTMNKVMGDKDWQANYQKFVPLVESGHREIFTIVE